LADQAASQAVLRRHRPAPITTSPAWLGDIHRMITETEPSLIVSGLRQAETGLPDWFTDQQISAWADFEW